ncbi:MAG: glycosyltransferase [Deltaproteobacteria bacterium]|jgi:tetratricopeptide (TPR) repeat protein|nr:glycosyltransferase [Deltaproteobacteria bacterium]
MLILCLGSEYFHEAFQKMGHTVMAPPHKEGYPVDALFNNLRDRPDMLVYTDHLGQHFWPDGIANVYGVPKVYYAVDTPINFWWQKHFSKLFDYVFCDQKPHAALLREGGTEASWLPVGVDAKTYLPGDNEKKEKLYDFGFVGVTDERRRPKRARLMNLLSRKYTLKTAGSRGDAWVGPDESGQIYRQSKLALNENLFPGVTMRMLEAMASGAVLFTEKAGGDLGELFKAGDDFAWFEPRELLAAAELWLGDDKLRAKTAKRAMEKVHGAHDIQNRAETLMETIKGVNPGKAFVDAESLDDEAKSLFLTAVRWPREEGQRRILRAEKLFEKARNLKLISPEGLFYLGHVERLKGNPEGAETYLNEAFEAGEPRGALSLGILALGRKNPKMAREHIKKFTGVDFSPLNLDTLHFEAVKLIAKRLLELGHDICPGFSRLPHDPALWTAFEYLQTAFQAKPEDPENARELLKILISRDAMAEAMDAAQKALEHNPDDPELGALYNEACLASYVTLN